MKYVTRLHALIFSLTLLSSALFAQNKDWLLKMQDPNVNFWELQKEFNDYWKGRTDFKGNGYKVFKRWEYINELRVSPDGKLPAPFHVMKEYKRYTADAPESASGAWTIMGPTTYPTNNTGQPTGKGRVNAIAFHPSDVNTLFVGSPSGGIWKSTNGGANWTDLSANIPFLGVSAILIHPSNPNIMYIGTGDRDGSDSEGFGVYKSTNGGSTWTQTSTGMGNATVGILLMHPSDPNTIIAATKSGIYKTTNAGVSWSLKQAGDFRDIKFKPGDPTVMFATRMITPSEFYRSTNTGDNWTQVTTPTTGVGSRMVIGVSPANTACVYLVQIKDTDKTFKAFLKSTDSGLTFTEQSNSPNIFDYNCGGGGTASQATYDLCIEVDRNDADIVYVGSINTWKSTNSGVNWTPVTNWVGSTYTSNVNNGCAPSVHADHHWFEWSPLHSPARLYLGHDGGITYTADGGTTWTEISNDLPTGQIYKIGQSAQAANTVTAGFQDNGVSATSDGTSFTTIGGGDGFDGIIDYNNANYCYYTVNGSLSRSTAGLFGSYSGVSSGIGGTPSFFAAYTLHNTDPNTLFFGRYEVWRSNNIRSTPSSSVSWTAISAFTGTDLIRVMEQSAANSNMMYIFRGSGSGSILYRSDNVNASAGSVVWNTITKPSSFNVSDIAAHPTNENIVFATAGMNVYKSTDKGVSWTNITGNLPALFINCLAIDKNANEGIYIGNEAGIWYKDATMTNWAMFNSGLPPVDVRELEIYYDVNPANNRITAATYGRGVWQSDLMQVNTINPTNFSATSVSNSQIDLSWTLNPSNDNVLIATSPTTIFGVPADGTAYTSGNSLPGGGTVVYVGNLTNFSHTGLATGTTYCYKIWSVNGSNQYSAGLTPICAATFSHNWTGNVNTDWFNPGNWGAGTVPTATDGAYIPAGRPNYPLINAAGATCYHLTIESGASVAMDAVTSYTLQVTGDWLNNGTFTRGVGTVEFNGTNAMQTIKGTSTSDFYILQVSKGSADNILDAISPITLNALVDAPLSLVSGTFRLSNAASNITAIRANGTNATNAIGLSKRFWVAAGVLNVTSSWRLNQGELRITGGTVNIGNASNHLLDYLNSNSALIIEGGALNVAARIIGNASDGSSTGSFTQSGGTLSLNTIGSTSTTRPLLQLGNGVPFTMSGGTIIVRMQSSHTTTDVLISSTTNNVTGGTLQIGDASTPAGQTIRINSTVPMYNLTVNATNAPTAQLVTNNLTVKNDITISGGTLNANNLNLNAGGHWTNNGTFTPGAGTVTFAGTVNQNLAGSTATTFNNLTMNNAAGLTLSGSVNTTVNGTLNLTSGVISTGANRVIIPASGSVARTSGHIFGNLQKNVATGSGVSRGFEIGDAASANYTPASLTFASVSAAGDLTAQTVSGDHPQIGSAALNAAKSVNRYWSLSNSGTTFTTCDAVFNFLNADLDPSVNTAVLICAKYDAPNWTYPTVGVQTANNTEITGITAFSDFQLAEAPCIDPDVPTLSASVNPICSGQSTTLSIFAGNLNGATNWQWYSGSCGGTSEGSGASIMVSPGTATTYYVRGEGGCVTPGSCGSITVTVNTPPTCSITGPGPVCANTTGHSYSAPMGMSGYAWSIAGNGTIPGSMTGQTVSVDAGAAGTYTVTLTLTNNGCTSSCSETVTVNANPACSITGLDPVCSGVTTSYSGPGGVTGYAWSVSGNASIPGATNGPSVSIQVGAAGTFTVSLTVTAANGCTSSCSKTVTVNAAPACSISGPDPVCASTTGHVYSAPTGMNGYSWSVNGNASIPGSSTGQTVSVNAGFAGSYTVELTVTDGNGCTSTCAKTVTVTANPSCSISGPGPVCANTTGHSYSAPMGMSGYAWSIAGNGTIPGSTTGQTVSVDAGAAGTYTVTLTLTNNGCTSSCSETVTVTANPTCSITGPGPVCANTTGHSYSAPMGMSGYAWSIAGNGTIPGSTTGQTVSVDAGVAGTYTVTLTVTNNGCTSSCSETVTVTANPTCSITGPGPVCANTTGHSYSAPMGMSGYAWSIAGNGTIPGSTTGQTVSVDAGAAGTYTVSLTVTNNGCTSSCSETVTVTANPTCSITGPGPVCTNTTGHSYSAPMGMSGYAWSIAGNGTIPGSTTGQTVSVNAGAVGTYTVTLTMANNGCTSSCSETVTVNNCNIEFSGVIKWEHDGVTGVNNATVNLTGATTGNDATDLNGDFLISVPYTTGSFTVKPVKNINRLNGVTSADAVAIQQHITLYTPITNPYKLIAADVNRSNSISTLDAALINQCILGNPAANAIFSVFWRFMPQTWAPVLPPWGFPEKIDLTGVSTNQSGLNFYGVKIGDVATTFANPANFGGTDPKFVLRTKDRALKSGDQLTVLFSAEDFDDLAAWQFALNFDSEKLQFDSLETLPGLPLTAEHFGFYEVEAGVIRSAWSQAKGVDLTAGTPVFRLRFRVKQTGGWLSEVMHLDDDILSGEAYTSKLGMAPVELSFSNATQTQHDTAEDSKATLQARPNPFLDATTLCFHLPEACVGHLRILDATGREILRLNKNWTAGYHEEAIRLDGVSGVLFAELVTPLGLLTQKIISVRR